MDPSPPPDPVSDALFKMLSRCDTLHDFVGNRSVLTKDQVVNYLEQSKNLKSIVFSNLNAIDPVTIDRILRKVSAPLLGITMPQGIKPQIINKNLLYEPSVVLFYELYEKLLNLTNYSIGRHQLVHDCQLVGYDINETPLNETDDHKFINANIAVLHLGIPGKEGRYATGLYSKESSQERGNYLYKNLEKFYGIPASSPIYLIVDTTSIQLEQFKHDKIKVICNIASDWDGAVKGDCNFLEKNDDSYKINDDKNSKKRSIFELGDITLEPKCKNIKNNYAYIKDGITIEKPIKDSVVEVGQLSECINNTEKCGWGDIEESNMFAKANKLFDIKRSGDAYQVMMTLKLQKDSNNFFIFVTLDHLAFLKARLNGIPSIFTNIKENTRSLYLYKKDVNIGSIIKQYIDVKTKMLIIIDSYRKFSKCKTETLNILSTTLLDTPIIKLSWISTLINWFTGKVITSDEPKIKDFFTALIYDYIKIDETSGKYTDDVKLTNLIKYIVDYIKPKEEYLQFKGKEVSDKFAKLNDILKKFKDNVKKGILEHEKFYIMYDFMNEALEKVIKNFLRIINCSFALQLQYRILEMNLMLSEIKIGITEIKSKIIDETKINLKNINDIFDATNILIKYIQDYEWITHIPGAVLGNIPDILKLYSIDIDEYYSFFDSITEVLTEYTDILENLNNTILSAKSEDKEPKIENEPPKRSLRSCSESIKKQSINNFLIKFWDLIRIITNNTYEFSTLQIQCLPYNESIDLKPDNLPYLDSYINKTKPKLILGKRKKTDGGGNDSPPKPPSVYTNALAFPDYVQNNELLKDPLEKFISNYNHMTFRGLIDNIKNKFQEYRQDIICLIKDGKSIAEKIIFLPRNVSEEAEFEYQMFYDDDFFYNINMIQLERMQQSIIDRKATLAVAVAVAAAQTPLTGGSPQLQRHKLSEYHQKYYKKYYDKYYT